MNDNKKKSRDKGFFMAKFKIRKKRLKMPDSYGLLKNILVPLPSGDLA